MEHFYVTFDLALAASVFETSSGKKLAPYGTDGRLLVTDNFEVT